MNEYQDQDVWFEVYGYDGFGWTFIADFDTREEAQRYADTSDVMSTYEDYRVKRYSGQA